MNSLVTKMPFNFIASTDLVANNNSCLWGCTYKRSAQFIVGAHALVLAYTCVPIVCCVYVRASA